MRMNAQDGQPVLLNPSQKNSLRISLLLVERGMLEMERLLSAGEYHGILFRITDDLGDDTKTAIGQLIHEVRGVIRELRDRFQLDLEAERTSRAIFGKAPLLWEIVTDSDTSRLRGYGQVQPGLKEILDPSIERLSQSLLRMHGLVSNNDRAFTRDRGGEQ